MKTHFLLLLLAIATPLILADDSTDTAYEYDLVECAHDEDCRTDKCCGYVTQFSQIGDSNPVSLRVCLPNDKYDDVYLNTTVDGSAMTYSFSCNSPLVQLNTSAKLQSTIKLDNYTVEELQTLMKKGIARELMNDALYFQYGSSYNDMVAESCETDTSCGDSSTWCCGYLRASSDNVNEIQVRGCMLRTSEGRRIEDDDAWYSASCTYSFASYLNVMMGMMAAMMSLIIVY
jgi:hypothetical protein